MLNEKLRENPTRRGGEGRMKKASLAGSSFFLCLPPSCRRQNRRILLFRVSFLEPNLCQGKLDEIRDKRNESQKKEERKGSRVVYEIMLNFISLTSVPFVST